MLENYLSNIIRMENIVDGMMVVDEDAVVVYYKNFGEYVPFTEKEAIGASLYDLYPDRTVENSPILKALYRGEATRNLDGSLVNYKGETVYLRTSTFPIKEGDRIIGAVNVVHDTQHEREMIDVTPVGGRTYKSLYHLADIIGRASKIQELRQRISKVAKTSSSVLICGETGTGKELVAQSIHTESVRRDKPFISQNCAAIPANLLESIFFGTTKGSYTGAENRPGIFEAANGGTVFLDEINSMDISIQAKLLRALESHKITRIGGTEEIRVDVRIIAATNEPPLTCIRQGKLRPDLFYRLGSVTIEVPPLRDRLDDLNLLLQYYMTQYNREMGKQLTGVSPEVLEILQEYSWPGNVREFRNVLEGAYNFCDGEIIQKEDLPPYILLREEELTARQKELAERNGGDSTSGNVQAADGLGEHDSLKAAVDSFEKQVILAEMKNSPNLSRLAERLGITRQTLNEKLKKHKLYKKSDM